MIGRFILLCDPEHFNLACDAAKYLLEHPEHKDVVTSQTDSAGKPRVAMYSKRMKKSISIRQVKP